jgi:hypothetical protein
MSKETNSKDTTDKKDEDVAAKNKDLQTLRGEVDIVKQYIKNKTEKETKEDKKTAEETYQKNRLSKTIKGLSGLEGLNLGLGQQSFKK